MKTGTSVLFVRNLEQAAAWLELDGQLSDGYWESASPGSHWRPWCDATVRIAKEGEKVGRTFHARRDKYALDSPSLLSVVGKRMLGIVRVARRCGLEVAEALEHRIGCDMSVDFEPPHPGGYWDEVRARLAKLDQAAILAALADESYTMQDLKRDLRDLKQIMRTRIETAA